MLAAFLMILSSLLFSFSYVFIKKSSMAVGFWETSFFRGLIGFTILTTILKMRGYKQIFGKKSTRFRLLLRGGLGGTGMVLYFYAFQHTSLANVASLHFTHPIFTTILAIPILGEKVTKSQIALLFLALSGVMLIFRPDLGIISFPSLAALMSGLFASMAYLAVRSLSSGENPLVIINSLNIAVILITSPFVILRWNSPVLKIWLFLGLVGILTTIAQYFMTLAYKFEEASKVAGFSFTAIIWAILLGKVIFGELPSLIETMGISLIFTSILGLVLLKLRRRPVLEA